MEDREGPPPLSPLRQRQLRRNEVQQHPLGITRRQFLKGAAGTTGAAILGVPVLKMLSRLVESTSPPAPVQPFPTIPTPQPTEVAQKTEMIIDKELLSKILSLPLDSPERKALEKTYFDLAKTLEQIDLGLGSLFYYKDKNDNNWELRKELIDRRFDLRQNGNPMLEKIGDDRIRWFEERGLHPEAAGMTLDAREKAKRVLIHQLTTLEGRKKFRPDLVYKESIGELPKNYLENLPLDVLVENCLINIAGLTRLICTETGWAYQKGATNPKFLGEKVLISYPLINLGGKPAVSQINSQVFEDDEAAFRTLSMKATEATGITINPDLYPGSTAGAVVTQMMPKNLWSIANIFDSAGEKFVFNNPTDAIAATWVFLAQGNKLPIRYGYFRGNEKVFDRIRRAALAKWNQVGEQINIIDGDANDYYKKFLANHQYAQ